MSCTKSRISHYSRQNTAHRSCYTASQSPSTASS